MLRQGCCLHAALCMVLVQSILKGLEAENGGTQKEGWQMQHSLPTSLPTRLNAVTKYSSTLGEGASDNPVALLTSGPCIVQQPTRLYPTHGALFFKAWGKTCYKCHHGQNQDLRLGLSWVLVLLNAYEIGIEEKQLALERVMQVQDDHPEKTAQKRLIFTSKWTTAWHHGVADALLNTHLQSFNSPIPMEEERPSLETPT